MPRVLIEVNPVYEPAVASITDRFRAAGIDVQIHHRWSPPHSQAYIRKKTNKFDAVLWFIHTRHKDTRPAVVGIRTRRRYVIEHDLFGQTPDLDRWHSAFRTIVFTNSHQNVARQRRCPKITLCQWYKLDLQLPDVPVHQTRDRNAIVIGSFTFKADAPFQFSHLFQHSFYKQWEPREPALPGTVAIPELCGPDKLLNMPKFSRIWFVRASSLAAEACLVGCVPVFYQAEMGLPHFHKRYMIAARPRGSVLSNVHLVKHRGTKAWGMGVTTDNLEEKLGKLQEPATLTEAVQQLQAYYFPTNYYSLPKVADVVLEDLKR